MNPAIHARVDQGEASDCEFMLPDPPHYPNPRSYHTRLISTEDFHLQEKVVKLSEKVIRKVGGVKGVNAM